MKRVILMIAVFTLFFSCKENTTDQNTENSKNNVAPKDTATEKKEVKEVPIKKKVENVKEAKEVVKSIPKIHITENQLQSTITDFKNCKATSEKRSDCRNSISKFISRSYHLNEFKDQNNNYVLYDSIHPIITRSSQWKRVGSATQQQNLDKASAHVGNGGLALVIDTSETYGHIAVIIPGESKKSGSWGLQLPKVISLSNHNPSKSFYNKTLAYAFKKSEHLKIYIRE